MAAGTPSMRVCIVDKYEDFQVSVTSDSSIADYSVEVVECGALADARVRLVGAGEEGQAEFTILIVQGASGWNDGFWDEGEWNE